MKLFDYVLIALATLCCTGGVVWLFYDAYTQTKLLAKKYEKEYEESTLGVVDDEDEE